MSSYSTIKIAHKEVSMEDMFKRPEYVSSLKQLQEILNSAYEQSTSIINQGLKPTAILVNRETYRLIRQHATPDIFHPVYESQNNPSDRLIGLDIAVLQNVSNTLYVKVVV